MSEYRERGKWENKTEFILSCIGYAVGLGNVWRFPYLCYKNGGGAFLVPYCICLLTGGIPVFLMEIALGQYFSQGGITVWDLCPLFKGIGYGTSVICFFLNTYYIIVLSWTVLYLFHSFTSVLPWVSCNNEWNTENCWNGTPNPTSSNVSVPAIVLQQNTHTTDGTRKTVDAVVEFWERKILKISNGIDEPGTIKWDLALCLLLVWILCYFCIWKSVKSTGKVAYFTALFPYVMLTILFIRGVTLPGAKEGIIYFLYPDFSRLLDGEVWIDAGTQIFFSFGISLGSMIALGSYNSFHNNFYKQCIVIALCNSCTSIYAGFAIFSVVGFMANQQGKQIQEIAESGPGLVFIAYPKAVTEMPLSPLWAILFFFMILVLGLNSQFVAVEGVITAMVDVFPHIFRRGYRREYFIAVVCLILFLLGLSMVSEGGMYVFQLMDYYSASGITLLWFSFFETVVVTRIYGVDRFYGNIEEMLGYRINPWLSWCWLYFTPLTTAAIFVFSIVTYDPLTYNVYYQYPKWAIAIGWLLALTSMVCIPSYAIFKFFSTPGTFLQRWNFLTTSTLSSSKTEDKQETTLNTTDAASSFVLPTNLSGIDPPADCSEVVGYKTTLPH
ncbi:sodium- and chloride-dependent GABA transporter 2-like [Limulus polyphemus]|uniref:Transporter n=1 Tax=Limulus polyphemus TaxID=6850 RepID=A0ABM1SVI6_LIMPO|nr:sodium- and chloride-dependent GABA transporter 2-like [Limulus polyphemus]